MPRQDFRPTEQISRSVRSARARRGAGLISVGVAASIAFLPCAAAATGDMQPSDKVAREAQWWLDGLGVTKAQQLSNGGAGVKVCLIDNGVDPTQDDLVGTKFADGTDLSGGLGSPDGLTPVPQTANVLTAQGTKDAALIAGQGHGPNHSLGIMGVAPKATVMSVIMNSNQDSLSQLQADTSKSIHYCADHGAGVIDVGPVFAPSRADMAYALKHNAVVISSSGQSHKGACLSMGGLQLGELTVTGAEKGEQFDPAACGGALMSLTGSMVRQDSSSDASVAIAAPDAGPKKTADQGYPLLLAAPRSLNDYIVDGRTTAAGSILAGVAALVRATYPHLSAAGVMARLLDTADNTETNPSVPGEMGAGVVNALRAVTGPAFEVSKNPLGDPATGAQGMWPTVDALPNFGGPTKLLGQVVHDQVGTYLTKTSYAPIVVARAPAANKESASGAKSASKASKSSSNAAAWGAGVGVLGLSLSTLHSTGCRV